MRLRSPARLGLVSSASDARSSRSSSATSGRAAITVCRGVRPPPGMCCGRNDDTIPFRVVTCPPSTGSSPARIRRSVDLPAPFGPTTPIRASPGTSKLRPWNRDHDPNSLRTSWRAMAVSAGSSRVSRDEDVACVSVRAWLRGRGRSPTVSVLDLLILLVVAGICGSLGRALFAAFVRIQFHIVRGPAAGDDVGPAVAVEVVHHQVLRRNPAVVDDVLRPFRS